METKYKLVFNGVTYAIFVLVEPKPFGCKFWQQISNQYCYKGNALKWAKRHNITLSEPDKNK